MKQKVALIRALIHDPQVLFLDEPTTAMDPHSARTVRDAIAELRAARRTVLLTTHNLTEAEAFRRIQKASMDNRKPMRAIAEAILLSNQVGASGEGPKPA